MEIWSDDHEYEFQGPSVVSRVADFISKTILRRDDTEYEVEGCVLYLGSPEEGKRAVRELQNGHVAHLRVVPGGPKWAPAARVLSRGRMGIK